MPRRSLLLATLFAAACERVPTATPVVPHSSDAVSTSSSSGPSASGAGHYTTGGELRTFSFTAQTLSDGRVTGQVQIFNRALNRRFHLEIVCLRLVGNLAYMSGPVTVTNDPVLAPVGLNSVLRAQDNGEGVDDPPDRISNAFGMSTRNCNTSTAELDPILTLNPVEQGNVQVRP